MMRRFLLVDDEINVLHSLQRALRHQAADKNVQIEIFTESDKALERVGEVAFDLVISDFRMPGIDGVEFLKAVKAIQPDAVRLMLSASSEFEAVLHAVNEAEIFRYIAKPWQIEELKNIIQLALARRDQLLEDRRLADGVRVKNGVLTPQEVEAKRLEEEEPGITKVKWGNDGEVYFD
jgi:DNA-binding NtrC family response regulator